MFSNFIDPTVREYLLINSLWRTFVGKVIFAAIVVALLVLAYFGWLGVIGTKNIFEILVWIPYAILGSVLGYLLIAFLDRERRVRVFHFLILLSVLVVTGPVAAFLNRHSPIKLWTVGFIEEGLKILPVLLLAIYVPNLIRTRKDGIVYGALAGMGFNIIEIGLYIANQLHDSPLLETLTMHSTRLSLLGIGGHIIWSAFVGMGIGFAAESTAQGWQKWKRTVLFYLLAALSHSLFDLGGSALGFMSVAIVEAMIKGVPLDSVNLSNPGALGPLNDGMRYGTYLYNIAFVVVLIVQIRRSFALENKLQVEELSTEDSSVIKPDELKQVTGERLFFKRHYGGFTKQIEAKIVLYQNLLAMQKHILQSHSLPVNTAPTVALLRGAIAALRRA